MAKYTYMFQREDMDGPFIEFGTFFDKIMFDFQHVMYENKYNKLPLYRFDGKEMKVFGVGQWKGKEAVFVDCQLKYCNVYYHLDVEGNLDPVDYT